VNYTRVAIAKLITSGGMALGSGHEGPTSGMTDRKGLKDPVDHAIAVLNEIHQADPTVLPALVAYRVPCNRALADHPTVQVGLRDGALKDDLDTGYEVGLLGILNGIFGIVPSTSWGHIAVRYEGGQFTGFVRLSMTERKD
jgi:hypothetical protein